jgi:hypothetical protein
MIQTRPIRALGAAALLAALVAVGPSATAQTAGTISGKVVNGTTQEPAAGLQVRVRLFSAQAELAPLTTTTDAKGRFVFDQLPAGVAGYQLEVAYRGAVYRSVATTFTAGAPNEQTLRVYEPTSDPADVTLASYVVWVDREPGGVGIQHDLTWNNAGKRAYVGDDGAVVRIPLPEGASSLQFLGTFLENEGRTRDGAYVSDAPLVPGESSATIRYHAPPLDRLTLEVPFPTTVLQLFVPQDVQVRAAALRLSGTVSDQGLTYRVYEARDLAAGMSIDVRLSQAAASGGSRAALWALLGALALVVLGAAAVVVRRRRAPAPARGRARTRTLGPAARPSRATASGNGGRVQPVLEDPDLIVEEIAALDLSFERGLIEERTYRRLRVAAKDRLLAAERARAGARRAR